MIEDDWDVVWIKKDDSRWSSWKRTWIIVLESVEIGGKLKDWEVFIWVCWKNDSKSINTCEMDRRMSFWVENHHWKGSWNDGTRCFFVKRCHYGWRKYLRHCLKILWLLGVLMLLWWDWFSRRCVFGIFEDVFQDEFVDICKKWEMTGVVKLKEWKEILIKRWFDSFWRT